MNISFLTTVTHNRYLYFLIPCLKSILSTHPTASITVYYSKISVDRLATLRLSFPQVTYKPHDVENGSNLFVTISSKMRCFLKEAALLPEGHRLVFLDCDTLVIKPLLPFFQEDFTCAYTWKEDSYPLNTGVILSVVGRDLVDLLEMWCLYTEETFKSEKSQRVATKIGGGGDQYALLRILLGDNDLNNTPAIDKTVRERLFNGHHQVSINGRQIQLYGFRCEDLNETHCGAITERTHVIHYKAGWHKILLDGAQFHPNRPEKLCREMYQYWRTEASSAYRQVAESVLMSIKVEQKQKFSFTSKAMDWVERGILNSEMLAVSAIAENLGVSRIIESGRWGGHSTSILSHYFEGTSTRIESIDYSFGPASKACERRLKGRSNVRLFYGDAFKLLPWLLASFGKPTMLLLDGPKGKEAVLFVKRLFELFPHLIGAFIHDTYIGSVARSCIEEEFPIHAFTDNDDYVMSYADLDIGIPFKNFGSGKYCGNKLNNRKPLSYGPTLALLLPHVEKTRRNIFYNYLQKLSWAVDYYQSLGLSAIRGLKFKLINSRVINNMKVR